MNKLTSKQEFELMREGDMQEVLAYASASTKFFSKLLFPKRFYRPYTDKHSEIFDVLDDESIKKVLVIGFRGFGKTSILQLAYPAKKILFRESKFIVSVGATEALAMTQSQNLKKQLMKNKIVRTYFGDIKPRDMIFDFSKHIWHAQLSDNTEDDSGTMYIPRGSGQQVRGLLGEDWRPDLILVDDLEKTREVMSEDQRSKLKDWFFGDLSNVIDRGNKVTDLDIDLDVPDWRLIVLGTLLHEDSLLQNLREDESWHIVEFPLCDHSYKSFWPSFMNDAQVRSLADEYRGQGKLDTFAREYMSEAAAVETKNFSQSMFKYYEEGKVTHIESVILVDPAKTTNMKSADSAIVGVGLNMLEHRIRVRSIVNGKLDIDQIIHESFAMADQLGTNIIAIEITSLEGWIKHPFINEAMKQGRVFEFIWLKAQGKKEDRVSKLVPYYRLGYIEHNRSASLPLETQLISFPHSKHWDVMDAFAYIPKLLEEGERYFSHMTEREDEIEEENYAELLAEDEETNNNWRLL